ncbi:hypothetical protein LVB77_10010 [Lysobacter sp. 5GHs7-4]|uniref:hypothetical protein n=1 Tax=Lysobacter sp. 5GHs7-4 TaxID=2904253 RepID=UPI001E28FB4E|nr:hypothetical protein [Lysobacter sp. 5GHs7-4]UHQ24976.1 hypothetical protein LVB77_10010 [Lysobacter sp. 5GHs7-4]
MEASYDFSDAKRGAVRPAKGMVSVTLFLEGDVHAATQEGLGLQAVINRTLRAAIAQAAAERAGV